LSRTPPPTKQDILLRTERAPMNRRDRKEFIKSFLPGLVLLITTYVMLTIIRDYRSNFASNIWTELGFHDASVFTKSELPASLVTLVLMGLLIFIKKNIYAFLINHLIIVIGFLLCISFTVSYINGYTTPFWWMTVVGVGLYMGYVPFNCMLFDRLIASFKYISNAGFIIYVADSFGYLGSNVILIAKNFLTLHISWSDFFVKLVLSMSVLGIVLAILSALYFKNKYYGRKISQQGLKYA
jgi:hypothetical protein